MNLLYSPQLRLHILVCCLHLQAKAQSGGKHEPEADAAGADRTEDASTSYSRVGNHRRRPVETESAD